MHKITVIIIFLAFTVTSVITELVLQDYIAKIYPDFDQSVTQAAKTSVKSIEDLFNQEGKEAKVDPVKTKEVQTDLAGSLTLTKEEDESPKEINESQDLPKEDRFFDKKSLESFFTLRLKEESFNNQVFGRVKVEPFQLRSSVVLRHIKNNQTFIDFTELHFDTDLSAKNFYNELSALAESYSDISVNTTDTYFNSSYFVNFDNAKDSVHLVGLKDQKVLLLQYLKNFHPIIKANYSK